MDDFHEPPEKVGLDACAWTIPLARNYLDQEFGVQYCDRHVRQLMTEARLSRQTAQPQYVDTDERTQEAFREEFKNLIDLDNEYTVTGLRELLRVSAEQRPPDRHIESIERFVDRGKIRDIGEVEFKNFAQFVETAETVFRFVVAVVAFEPIIVDNEVLPAGKPTFGGLACIGPQRLFG